MADDSSFFLRRAATVVRCIIKTLILLLIAVSLGSLIAWLILRPHVPNFHVKSLHLSDSTAAGKARLSFDYEIKLVVENPNHKINLFFHYLNVSIMCGKDKLSEMKVPQFSVRKSGKVEKVVKSMANGGGIGGVFGVSMWGTVVLRNGKWMSKETVVEVQCKHMTALVGRNRAAVAGKMIGGSCSSSFV